jgi:hypothetical protein
MMPFRESSPDRDPTGTSLEMPTHRFAPMLLGLGCALALVLSCFHTVLFRGHQFAYRDAGHFYYPLYRLVQQEWAAGRWPLWNSWQNGGTPLLGMPMAAVLYPGKLIYALLPYAQAARVYVIAHTIVALLGMLALGRTLRLSGIGSSLAALSFAFGTPVLSLHSNVIYLVGAAWIPWGFRAIRRLTDPGHRWAAIELAIVLALQVLGGDPESAYLTVASGALYAGVLAFTPEGPPAEVPRRRKVFVSIALAMAATWSILVLAAGHAAARGWSPTWPADGLGVSVVFGVAFAILLVWRAHRVSDRAGPRGMLAGLAIAGLLSVALTAVQIGPTWQYASRSTRLGGPSKPTTYDFSVEPYRMAEAVWPHVSGLEVPETRSWIQALPPAGERMIWSPSLYLGAFVLVLAVGGGGLRGGPPWRRWLTILGAIGLLGAMGKFAGPLWWARWIPGTADLLGRHDPAAGLARPDECLTDGAGSVYWSLATLLPGFGLFRYPGKLMVFTGLCASVLAGLGWDGLCGGESPARSTRRWCLGGLAASAGVLLLVLTCRSAIERWLGRHAPASSLYGPLDAVGAVNQALWALVQGGTVYAAGTALASWAVRRPSLAGAGALVLVMTDLALAGYRIVWTVPQDVLETTPLVARLIDRAEKADPSPGPFRIHRVEQWHPHEFSRRRSPERLSELVAWELDTLDRLHAEPFALPYTVIRGVIDLGEYLDFFEAQATWTADDRGIERPIYSFPRGGYDLWNARYFVMPVGLNGWMGPERGFTRIAPGDDIVGDPERARRWIDGQGWQLLRNERAFPRCWVVPSAVIIPPTAAGSRERAELVRTLVDSAGGAPTGRGARAVDLRRSAFIETDDPTPLAALRQSPSGEAAGSATIGRAGPQRVEIRADLRRPALVILADVFDPEWHLAIDGAPAPIWRVNRMMRGAFVPAGNHALVYTYRPEAFRIGAVVSLCGLILLASLVYRAARS